MMTDKDLRKLSRMDLLEMLIEQGREVERLKNELKEAKDQLVNKELVVQEAGSLAEAALKVNGVYEAAEAAAQQYLDNIKNLSAKYETICKQKEAACEARIEKMILETNKYCDEMKADALKIYQKAENLRKPK